VAEQPSRQQAFPTPGELGRLPEQLRMTIPAEWEDRNEHVNVQYYVTLYELGSWTVLEDEGIDEKWFQQREISLFDLEHHLQYRSEVVAGDEVVTYNRLLGLNDKCFRGMYFIVNETRGRLAATLEYITAGVDMRTRRISPFPEELSMKLGQVLEKHRQLEWTTPVCGVMKP